MHIPRSVIAKLLETKPSNIKSLKQIEDNIYIQLADCEDELFISVREYESCLQQLRPNKTDLDRTKFISIAIIIGTFICVTLSSINQRLAITESSATPVEYTDSY